MQLRRSQTKPLRQRGLKEASTNAIEGGRTSKRPVSSTRKQDVWSMHGEQSTALMPRRS